MAKRFSLSPLPKLGRHFLGFSTTEAKDVELWAAVKAIASVSWEPLNRTCSCSNLHLISQIERKNIEPDVERSSDWRVQMIWRTRRLVGLCGIQSTKNSSTFEGLSALFASIYCINFTFDLFQFQFKHLSVFYSFCSSLFQFYDNFFSHFFFEVSYFFCYIFLFCECGKVLS